MSDETAAPPVGAPAVDGWFTTDPEPALVGSRCTGSGTYFFPPTDVSRAPGHGGGPTESVVLSPRGRLWSYTSAGYRPPEPYLDPPGGFEPFVIAAVELEREGLVILGQLPPDVDVDSLHVGMPMQLIVDTLYEDETGARTIWKWIPDDEEAHR